MGPSEGREGLPGRRPEKLEAQTPFEAARMEKVRCTAGETIMKQGCNVQDLQKLTQALQSVFEDVSVVELPPECEDHWQDDAMQASY